ncbi:MAG: hypothetical protein JNM17_31950 [Archangium sp.]|nr:hypothetical protein [Archangium sp.]
MIEVEVTTRTNHQTVDEHRDHEFDVRSVRSCHESPVGLENVDLRDQIEMEVACALVEQRLKRRFGAATGTRVEQVSKD